MFAGLFSVMQELAVGTWLLGWLLRMWSGIECLWQRIVNRPSVESATGTRDAAKEEADGEENDDDDDNGEDVR